MRPALFNPFETPAGETLLKLERFGIPFVINGGYVRDFIMGRRARDVDAAVCADFADVLSASGGRETPCRAVRLIRCPDCDLVVFKSWNDFWRQSDFTVNSMHVDRCGRLNDIFGGRRDIEDGVLRMTSRQALHANPCNILRGCRFMASLGFSPERETLDAMRKIPKSFSSAFFIGRYALKIWLELKKVFSQGLEIEYFSLLYELKLLRLVVPPLKKLWDKDEAAAADVLKELADTDIGADDKPRLLLDLLLEKKGGTIGETDIERFLEISRWDRFSAYEKTIPCPAPPICP